ncbi:flagellar biosynthesis repressor FlbT [Roseibium sp. RKSG952]|uniref:flagellar biosynthesis repressor FlbT n=1 Tax=Roseibium sp. RKSG952 TaxID=2529384 RepID=UPI0012BD81E1|nr:flagellar biosynthesis repressor FlbT [Roseibium sp. RKSG952]MTH98279.1 flagellar biosynthesis repressor FlbT [Roseibium sp. RKSG952]
MKIGLKAGERLFINGAVLRADRKTNIELMNDAVFLLEGHILQAEDATTPLRQVYFILQTMIMDPASAKNVNGLFESVMGSVRQAFSNPNVLERLEVVDNLAASGKWFEAMKVIRSLYPIEEALMFRPKKSGGQAAQASETSEPQAAVG